LYNQCWKLNNKIKYSLYYAGSTHLGRYRESSQAWKWTKCVLVVSFNLASAAIATEAVFRAWVKVHDTNRDVSTRVCSTHLYKSTRASSTFSNILCCAFHHVCLIQWIYIIVFGVVPKLTRYIGPNAFGPQGQKTNQQYIGSIKWTTAMFSNISS